MLAIRCTWLAAAICFTTVLSGCASSHKRFWAAPNFADPLPHETLEADLDSPHPIEAVYASAVQLEQDGSGECVDEYFRCATMLWPEVVSRTAENNSRASQLYRSSVAKLIETGQEYGRFDPVQGIVRSSDDSENGESLSRTLPVRYHGFAWHPENFERISIVGKYQTPDVIEPHQQDGLGVPLLVHHTSQQPFVYRDAKFTATAILRPDNAESVAEHNGSFVLDIINPHTIRDMRITGERHLVAYDLTAPLAYFSINDTGHEWLTGLIRPEEVEDSTGLTMVEPYRPGKIPVVFVHGLASEPMTWAAMANELFNFPDLMEHYQFWIFSYPTGKPFPNEAANLRRQLVELRDSIDPDKSDPALDHMVLIGHSMGGLISKLQITSSGEQLAHSIFKVPLDELEMTPDMRKGLNDFLYFEPSGQVNRVIFIGTPHGGSKLASGTVGSITSHLVRQSGTLVDQCTQFIRLNQDAFTTPMRRIPTSVDLLRPDSPLLQAIFDLPVNPRVRMHSIIGIGHAGLGKETGDGVVPVTSARHPGVESELLVKAKHDLHHHPDTINEVVRILRLHASAEDRHLSPAGPLAAAP